MANKTWRDYYDRVNQCRYRQTARKKKRELVNRFKCRPCADCGVQYNPWVMEFDHRDPAQKKMAIANMVSKTISRNRLLEEISKCDVVCANCHAERTYQRKDYLASRTTCTKR